MVWDSQALRVSPSVSTGRIGDCFPQAARDLETIGPRMVPIELHSIGNVAIEHLARLRELIDFVESFDFVGVDSFIDMARLEVKGVSQSTGARQLRDILDCIFVELVDTLGLVFYDQSSL